VTFRDLTSLAEFAQVVQLEREIWGPNYDDVVPVPILAVTVFRGGVLIGAFDDRDRNRPGSPGRSGPRDPSGPHERHGPHDQTERLVGFVYSLPGIKHGKPTQWSHMLGVLNEFRNSGVGFRLKMLQRDRAREMGLDLIEWTYDPMQALNAHLNFTKLGVIVSDYEINVYGESRSPLHAGNPTDRFVAEWWIRREALSAGRGVKSAPGVEAEAVAVNRIDRSRRWPACVDVVLDVDVGALRVDIPMNFGEMLTRAPDVALDWRLKTRQIFTTYFARGFKAVDFRLDRAAASGAYLLVV
jgi:predicted GNAT superfamily acetyltransferase